MRQGNVLNVLLSFIIPEWDIEKQEEYTIKGYSFDETMEIERLRMKESIDNATIVAARKANINLTILREVPTVIIKYDNADTGIRLMDKIVFSKCQKSPAKAGAKANMTVYIQWIV